MIDEAETRMGLLKQMVPIVVLKDEVNPEQYLKIRDAALFLQSRGSPPAKLLIDSGGGQVAPGLDIFDVVRLYAGGFEGIVVGRAASMASVILQACTIRKCARHAGILIHHVSRRSVSLDEIRLSGRRKKMVDVMDEDQQRLYKILADRTKQPLPLIRKTCRKDEFMSAEEAKEFGLIDEIV